jgi:hypothetical protein
MVMFGGGNDVPSPLVPCDLWALYLGAQPNWTLLNPFPPVPSGIFSHSAIYDSLYGRMVIFGGRTGLASYTDELWWIQM